MRLAFLLWIYHTLTRIMSHQAINTNGSTSGTIRRYIPVHSFGSRMECITSFLRKTIDKFPHKPHHHSSIFICNCQIKSFRWICTVKLFFGLLLNLFLCNTHTPLKQSINVGSRCAFKTHAFNPVIKRDKNIVNPGASDNYCLVIA